MKVECRTVEFGFGAEPVLKDLTLPPCDARCLVLIGPSGGGKSTLLRLLAGLDAPRHGQVLIDDAPIGATEEDLRAHRRRVGTVFQAFNLFPHLTARENILLPLVHVHRQDPEEARHAADALLQRFQLRDHADKRPGQLSGGQRQRVAIVRAVAVKPRFLVFDEPTSALDPEMTVEVLDMIGELRSEGRDLVLVTHHLAFAQSVADQAAFLADGHILEYGPAQQVFSQPATHACQRFLEHVLRFL